jgi:hypothetical protein
MTLEGGEDSLRSLRSAVWLRTLPFCLLLHFSVVLTALFRCRCLPTVITAGLGIRRSCVRSSRIVRSVQPLLLELIAVPLLLVLSTLHKIVQSEGGRECLMMHACIDRFHHFFGGWWCENVRTWGMNSSKQKLLTKSFCSISA